MHDAPPLDACARRPLTGKAIAVAICRVASGHACFWARRRSAADPSANKTPLRADAAAKLWEVAPQTFPGFVRRCLLHGNSGTVPASYRCTASSKSRHRIALASNRDTQHSRHNDCRQYDLARKTIDCQMKESSAGPTTTFQKLPLHALAGNNTDSDAAVFTTSRSNVCAPQGTALLQRRQGT